MKQSLFDLQFKTIQEQLKVFSQLLYNRLNLQEENNSAFNNINIIYDALSRLVVGWLAVCEVKCKDKFEKKIIHKTYHVQYKEI